MEEPRKEIMSLSLHSSSSCDRDWGANNYKPWAKLRDWQADEREDCFLTLRGKEVSLGNLDNSLGSLIM